MSDMQSDKLRFICAIKYQYSQRPGTLSNIQNSACHTHVTLVGPCSSAAGPFLLAVAPAAVMPQYSVIFSSSPQDLFLSH